MHSKVTQSKKILELPRPILELLKFQSDLEHIYQVAHAIPQDPSISLIMNVEEGFLREWDKLYIYSVTPVSAGIFSNSKNLRTIVDFTVGFF